MVGSHENTGVGWDGTTEEMLTTELDSVLILHILITGEEPKNKWHNNILVPRAFPVENGRGGKRKKA